MDRTLVPGWRPDERGGMRGPTRPEGVPAMIVASQIRDHQSRCQPHLLRLRMLTCTGSTR